MLGDLYPKISFIVAHVTALVRMDVGVTTTAVRLVVDDTGWAARLFWDVGLCVERSEHAASSGLAPFRNYINLRAIAKNSTYSQI